MICDNCTHNEVCVHKEDCNVLERSTQPYKLEEWFSLKIECQYKEIRGINLRSTGLLDSWRMP